MSEQSTLDMDVRILRRQLNKGFISESAVKEKLSSLPDVEGQGEYFDPATLEGDDEVSETDGSTETVE